MTRLAFTGARIMTPDQVLFGSTLLVNAGRINAIVSNNEIPEDYELINLEDNWLLPGFIDIHVHGGGGYDTSDGTVEAIRGLADYHLKFGTTAIYPTCVTHQRKVMLQALYAVEKAMAEEDLNRRVLGLHLEGPYLSKERAGAQNPEYIMLPKQDDYRQYLDHPALKLMTIAPEIEGMEDLLEYGLKKGIYFAAGHSSADYEQGMAGFALGISQVSHLYNAMTGLDRRHPGLSAAALVHKDAKAQLICDGIHVHPAMIKLAMGTKEANGTILITDALRGPAPDETFFTMGELEVEDRDGAYYLNDGTLAGSKLTMVDALSNAIKLGGVALQAAVKMATLTPAQAMDIDSFKGSLTPGHDADLVVLDDRLEIQQVWSLGRRHV